MIFRKKHIINYFFSLASVCFVLCVVLLSNSGCTKNDDVNNGKQSSVVGNLSFVFRNASGGGKTKLLEGKTKSTDTITDVKTEGSLPHERRIEDALVLLFEKGANPATQELVYIFGFQGSNNTNYESQQGGLFYNPVSGTAVSQIKRVDPDTYHAVIISNFVSSFFGDVSTFFANYSTLKSQMSGKGVDLTYLQGWYSLLNDPDYLLWVFKDTPEITYMSKLTPTTTTSSGDVVISGWSISSATVSSLGLIGQGEKDYIQNRPAHIAYYEDANFQVPEGYTFDKPYRKYISLIRPCSKIRVRLTNINEATGKPYLKSLGCFLSVEDGLKLENFINEFPVNQWISYPTSSSPTKNFITVDIEEMFVPKFQGNATIPKANLKYPYFFSSRAPLYNSHPYPLLFYLMAGDNPEIYTRDGYDSPILFSPWLMSDPSSYYNSATETYADGVDAVTLYEDFLSESGYAENGYNEELFSTYCGAWNPMYPKQLTLENATTLVLTFERRDYYAPNSGNPTIAEGGKMISDGTGTGVLPETDVQPFGRVTYRIPIINPTSDPLASTPNLIDSHPYLNSSDYSIYTILKNYLYQLNIIFRGLGEPLEFRITASPMLYEEHGGFDADWLIN